MTSTRQSSAHTWETKSCGCWSGFGREGRWTGWRAVLTSMLSSSLDKLLWSNAICVCHVVVFSVSELHRILHQISDSLFIAVIKKKKSTNAQWGQDVLFFRCFFFFSSEYFGVLKSAGLFTSVVWWGILETIYRLEKRNSKVLQIFTNTPVLVCLNKAVGGPHNSAVVGTFFGVSELNTVICFVPENYLPEQPAFGIPAECFTEHPEYRLPALVIIICDPQTQIGNLLVQLIGTKFRI